MKFLFYSKLTLAILLFWAINGPLSIQAQRVTNAWATLPWGVRPLVIAIDASGNIYSANYKGGTLSKITPGGVLTPAWASFPTAIIGPSDIGKDASGNLYVPINNQHVVSKITSEGVATQNWVSMPVGTYPTCLVLDASGNIYTMNQNNTVSKITAAGSLTLNWATLSSTAMPVSIVIDASGNLYTLNQTDNTISKITATGNVTQAWASLGSGATHHDLAIDAAGNLYSTGFSSVTNNGFVSKITAAGVVTQNWATLAAGATPRGITIDASGNIYTANTGTNTVSKITTARVIIESWGVLAAGSTPVDVQIDASGNAYTANWNSNTVSKIEPCGCNPSCNLIATAAGTYTGATSQTDTAGFTHYCDASGYLLLSTKPVTATSNTTINPSDVRIEIGSPITGSYAKWCGAAQLTPPDACFMVLAPSVGNGIINRRWHISAVQGTPIGLANRLNIAFYFTNAEYTALNTTLSTNGGTAMTASTQLSLFLPRRNLNLGAFPASRVESTKYNQVWRYTHAASPSSATWTQSTPANGALQANFFISTIANSGGIGQF